MTLDDRALDTIFRHARTYNHYRDRPVDDATLRAIYDVMKWGPTSANSSPARFVFVRSKAAKAKLGPTLAPASVPWSCDRPVRACRRAGVRATSTAHLTSVIV